MLLWFTYVCFLFAPASACSKSNSGDNEERTTEDFGNADGKHGPAPDEDFNDMTSTSTKPRSLSPNEVNKECMIDMDACKKACKRISNPPLICPCTKDINDKICREFCTSPQNENKFATVCNYNDSVYLPPQEIEMKCLLNMTDCKKACERSLPKDRPKPCRCAHNSTFHPCREFCRTEWPKYKDVCHDSHIADEETNLTRICKINTREDCKDACAKFKEENEQTLDFCDCTLPTPTTCSTFCNSQNSTEFPQLCKKDIAKGCKENGSTIESCTMACQDWKNESQPICSCLMPNGVAAECSGGKMCDPIHHSDFYREYLVCIIINNIQTIRDVCTKSTNVECEISCNTNYKDHLEEDPKMNYVPECQCSLNRQNCSTVCAKPEFASSGLCIEIAKEEQVRENCIESNGTSFHTCQESCKNDELADTLICVCMSNADGEPCKNFCNSSSNHTEFDQLCKTIEQNKLTTTTSTTHAPYPNITIYVYSNNNITGLKNYGIAGALVQIDDRLYRTSETGHVVVRDFEIKTKCNISVTHPRYSPKKSSTYTLEANMNIFMEPLANELCKKGYQECYDECKLLPQIIWNSSLSRPQSWPCTCIDTPTEGTHDSKAPCYSNFCKSKLRPKYRKVCESVTSHHKIVISVLVYGDKERVSGAFIVFQTHKGNEILISSPHGRANVLNIHSYGTRYNISISKEGYLPYSTTNQTLYKGYIASLLMTTTIKNCIDGLKPCNKACNKIANGTRRPPICEISRNCQSVAESNCTKICSKTRSTLEDYPKICASFRASVKVTGENGVPIPGVHLDFALPRKKHKKHSFYLTDKKGTVQLFEYNGTTYDLTATKNNYESFTKQNQSFGNGFLTSPLSVIPKAVQVCKNGTEECKKECEKLREEERPNICACAADTKKCSTVCTNVRTNYTKICK